MWTTYCAFLGSRFPACQTSGMSIARLKITLDNVKPAPMRRVEVPLGIKLSDLHHVIQAAMPWEDCHLYEFRVKDTRWGIPMPEFLFGDGPLDARKTSLADVIEMTGAKSITYWYDFGDDWYHTVKIEKIVEAEADAAYPRLLDAKVGCPPEDCGGPWGYGDLLEAIADPAHDMHDQMIEWHGSIDPATVDLAELTAAVAKLAGKSAAKKSAATTKAKKPAAKAKAPRKRTML
jgi:hypothetical protein